MEVTVDQNSNFVQFACGERAYRTSVNAAVSFRFGISISWLMDMLKAREVNASQAEEYGFLHHDADSARPTPKQKLPTDLLMLSE